MININYDPKTNIGSARKVIVGPTNYYVGISKICPICEKSIIGYSAISRKDNKTEICSNCSSIEGLESFIKYKGEIENGTKSN